MSQNSPSINQAFSKPIQIKPERELNYYAVRLFDERSLACAVKLESDEKSPGMNFIAESIIEGKALRFTIPGAKSEYETKFIFGQTDTKAEKSGMYRIPLKGFCYIPVTKYMDHGGNEAKLCKFWILEEEPCAHVFLSKVLCDDLNETFLKMQPRSLTLLRQST